MHRMVPHSLAAAALLLLPLASADLTGSLTTPESASDSEIVQVSVTNTGPQSVAILARNNLFDTRSASTPFWLNDTSGNPIPLGGLHVKTGGMTQADFLDLSPGANFTRIFNLSDYILGTPNQTSTTTVAILAVPTSYMGLEHNGTFTIPPAASASYDSANNYIPGDPTAANLQPISLTCPPLALNVTIPAAPPPPPPPPPPPSRRNVHNRRERAGLSGMYVYTDCPAGEKYDLVMAAINDSTILAQAGMNAIKDAKAKAEATSPYNPFPWFFGPDSATVADIVYGVLERYTESSQANGGTFIVVRCTDTSPVVEGKTMCQDQQTIAFEWTDPDIGMPTISLCPPAFTFERNPWPCTAPAGWQNTTLAHVLVHEGMHVQNLVGFAMAPQNRALPFETYQPGPAHSLAWHPLGGAYINPDNYAWMCDYSWEAGLGGTPWTGQECLATGFTAPQG